MQRRHLAECGSTNTEALQHLRDGGGALLISAGRQTAGRGRLGRAWQSDDAALTFSLARYLCFGALSCLLFGWAHRGAPVRVNRDDIVTGSRPTISDAYAMPVN